MPKIVKYGRWEHEYVEGVPEAVRVGDVGVHAASDACLVRKLPEETVR
jgi:hypothetical protein